MCCWTCVVHVVYVVYEVYGSDVEMCTFLMSLTMSYPVMIAVPLDGLMSPVNILKVVVLPAPTQIR